MTKTDMNCFLAAWADRWVYCADRAELELVQAELSNPTPPRDASWASAARQPLFGHPDRISSMPKPTDKDLVEVATHVKNWFAYKPQNER
jgi:hypothetical protein